MMDFLFNYGWIIVVTLGFAGYIFYLYKKQGKKAALTELREKVYKAMLIAEKKFDVNEEKFEWVAKKIFLLLPDTAKVIIEEETIEDFIQNCYNKMMDGLDDGKFNDSNE